ncbi:hypothetical protein BDY24DRAFT_416933 [Mrakia frigida]|uniref:uncharacterized protein n=1 Tax=Mrakia frigida TaxID=29902 RepID=UPI003FCC0EF3
MTPPLPIQDAFIGNSFLDGFCFQSFDDPTHGRVNYVDQTTTAAANNLTYSNPNTFVMRADYQKVVQPGQRGRDSMRIASKKLYNDAFENALWQINSMRTCN